ncbi:MAG: SRPBCC family protein [Candidimonas sp.]|nr:MAG: SRPBCC family protein [Candidimonas sp.]TAM22422.1 MAG: SRPBCC family protein [Candidimonas sp.]
MSEEGFKPGRIHRLDGCFQGRLERFFEHDQDAVWRMLTEPQELAKWLAPGTIEQRIGGAVHIEFEDSGITIHSTVLEWNPPRQLQYSWSSGDEPVRPLHWELVPVGNGTQLILTIGIPLEEDAAKACAGFDAHLEMLAAALEGVPIRFPLNQYLQARRSYQELLSQ